MRPPVDSLDELDPADVFAEHDARERARTARAAQRRQRRAAKAPWRAPKTPAGHDGHGQDAHVALHRTRAGLALILLAAAITIATVAGLIALWPAHAAKSGEGTGTSLAATVASAAIHPCDAAPSVACRFVTVRLGEGRDKGKTTHITIGPVKTKPALAPGDRVRVDRVPLPTGAAAAALGPHPERYAFIDFDRRGSLLWLGLAFCALVLIVARWRGLLAILGVGLSLLLVTKFVVPALLAGSSPLLVSLVGALAVMLITIVLTNGIGAQSLAAAVGIATSLLLAGLLASVYVHTAHLTGLSSDLAAVLLQSPGSPSLQGVVIAGMVIGALGVLVDIAVSQASSVMALRRANPNLGALALYRGAFVIGRDHLSATLHTLVLAYAGASLPLLLVIQASHAGFTDALNSQDIAEPIVSTLVGSIGLIAAVPFTTALAATLVSRVPVAALPEGHGHTH